MTTSPPRPECMKFMQMHGICMKIVLFNPVILSQTHTRNHKPRSCHCLVLKQEITHTTCWPLWPLLPLYPYFLFHRAQLHRLLSRQSAPRCVFYANFTAVRNNVIKK